MAERRSIYKKITSSDSLMKVCDRAKLFYTWSIPHADDLGILPFSQMSLKAKIFPLIDCSSDDVDRYIRELAITGHYKAFSYGEKRYWFITNFFQYQTIKKDRQPQTLLPLKLSDKPSESWAIADKELNRAITEHGLPVESIWNPDGTLVDTELSEVKGIKGSEVNIAPQAVREVTVNDLITLFEPINPSFERLYSNKTQRAAMDRLLKKFGGEKMTKTIQSLPAIINKPYAPTITTPVQLESKLGSLISFYYKQKNNQTTIIGL